MKYILIDMFGGHFNIINKEEGSEEPLILDGLKAAEEALKENCQDGIIVPLSPVIPILKEAHDAVGMAKFELGEEWDEGGDNSIEGRIGEFLEP